jgi:CRISPR/Cas system-associated exonuclease Cas4 (RecB family)
MTEETRGSNSFVTQDKLTKDLEKAFQDEATSNLPILNSSFDPSELTQCPRRLLYKVNGEYEGCLKGEDRKRNFTVSKWLDAIKKCRKMRLMKERACVSDCNYNIVGYLDAVVEVSDRLAAVKVQGVSHSDFKDIQRKGAKRKQVVEVMAYIWMTEINDGLLIYEDETNDEFTVFHIVHYEPIVQSIQRKCLTMLKYQQEGRLPSRPYKTNDGGECKSCEFNRSCWGAQYAEEGEAQNQT